MSETKQNEKFPLRNENETKAKRKKFKTNFTKFAKFVRKYCILKRSSFSTKNKKCRFVKTLVATLGIHHHSGTKMTVVADTYNFHVDYIPNHF